MISKREAAQRLLARWLDEVASGEATLTLREFITAGQVDAVIAFDLFPNVRPPAGPGTSPPLRAWIRPREGRLH